jgi:hypothetical protein
MSDRGMIQHQADDLYLSGHGLHKTATFNNVSPEQLDWSHKNVVIIAGCSVLDIDNLNGNTFQGEPPYSNPGRRWANLDVSFLLGYNYYAPTDERNGDPYYTAQIVSNYIGRINIGEPPIWAWGHANADMNAPIIQYENSPWNSCGIDTENRKYWYWDRVSLFHNWLCYDY